MTSLRAPGCYLSIAAEAIMILLNHVTALREEAAPRSEREATTPFIDCRLSIGRLCGNRQHHTPYRQRGRHAS